jgi:hypothetical protein
VPVKDAIRGNHVCGTTRYIIEGEDESKKVVAT